MLSGWSRDTTSTTSATYWQEAAPVTMALPLSSQAEHVGVLRSTGAGENMPAIISKSLYAILSCDMARRHRGNTAVSLRVEAIYFPPCQVSRL